jgi:hypothetical protein
MELGVFFFAVINRCQRIQDILIHPEILNYIKMLVLNGSLYRSYDFKEVKLIDNSQFYSDVITISLNRPPVNMHINCKTPNFMNPSCKFDQIDIFTKKMDLPCGCAISIIYEKTDNPLFYEKYGSKDKNVERVIIDCVYKELPYTMSNNRHNIGALYPLYNEMSTMDHFVIFQ